MEQQEITETELILLLDDKGIGQATYNKIKKDFRVTCLRVGIQYDKKERIYRVGAKEHTLFPTLQKEEGK